MVRPPKPSSPGASPWSETVSFRIAIQGKKRKLQQRWTRCKTLDVHHNYRIEEEWRDVPEVILGGE